MALSGSLLDFPLEGVLRLLESSRKTGVLEISAEGERGTLEMTDGSLTAARYGEDVGDVALGQILGLEQGSFSFRAGDTGDRNLSGSIDMILERASEERSKLLEIRRSIPDDRMRFQLSERALAGGEITIAPRHWHLLLNVDGHRDVVALAELIREGRTQTRAQLHELLRAGLIDALEPLPEPEPAPPPVIEAAPAWKPEPPAWSEPPPAAEAPPVVEPLAAETRREPEAPAAAAWPAFPRTPEPSSEELSSLLEQRLAALDQSGRRRGQPATSPEDFWSQVQAQTAAPQPPAVGPAPAAPEDADDRLAALFGRVPTAEPAPPPVEPSGERQTASAADEPFASHYLPADATAPILEVEAPPPVKEERRRGFFGFGRKQEAPAPVAAPAFAATVTSLPGRLASFANALLTEYNSGQYGKQRLDERMNVRLRLVDEQAEPIDRMLPVQDDRLDVGAIDRDFSPDQAAPYLATLIRQLFEDAERVFGKDKAKKGYRSAVKNALGGDESVLHGPAIASILPKL